MFRIYLPGPHSHILIRWNSTPIILIQREALVKVYKINKVNRPNSLPRGEQHPGALGLQYHYEGNGSRVRTSPVKGPNGV